jgi:hypothetical protein
MEKYVGCCIADLRYLGVSENRVPLIPLMKHNYLYQHCHFREYKPLSAAKRLFKLNCVLKLPLHQSLACPRLDLEKKHMNNNMKEPWETIGHQQRSGNVWWNCLPTLAESVCLKIDGFPQSIGLSLDFPFRLPFRDI